jgi:hypothetical protein
MTSWYQRLWFDDADARLYGAVRVSYAVIALLNLVELVPYRYAFFSDAGVVDRAAMQGPGHFGIPHFSLFNVFGSEVAVNVLFAMSAVALVLLALGIAARLAVFWVFIWHLSISYRAPIAVAGWDDILRVYGFLLLISPLAAAWPFRLKKSAQTEWGGTIPVYGLQLMRLQLMVIYWHTAVFKIPDEAWIQGEVLADYLMSTYARFPSAKVLVLEPVLKLITWASLVGEIALPFLLLFQKTRPWAIVLGFLFHLGIFVLSKSLLLFCLVMVPPYIAFLDPQTIAWFQARWAQIRKRFAR